MIEWSSAMINALRRYWNRDNDVAVFALVIYPFLNELSANKLDS